MAEARFTDALRRAADHIWAAQHAHPFVRGIGDGTLAHDRFRHYVRQDYLFLIEYARLLSFAAARAPAVDVARRFAALAHETHSVELALHRSYAVDWGIAEDELQRERMTPTTRAYADFLVRTAATGDHGEVVAAVLPCMWGYSEVGTTLAERGRTGEELYVRWIDMYASPEFAELAAWCRTVVDEVAREAGGTTRARMQEVFLECSRLELAFWDASWRLEPAV
jgi:thiaminase/transcriptional activator TenA